MSIVTYDDLDTPVFELDTMRYLFRDGLQGMWIDFLPDYAFADTDLTTPANPGEGIAGYVDRGPYGYNDTQPVITARPILGRVPVGGRRNLLTYTEDLSNAVWLKNWVAASTAIDETRGEVQRIAASGSGEVRHIIRQDVVASGQSLRYFLVKADTGRYIGVNVTAATVDSVATTVVFDAVTGAYVDGLSVADPATSDRGALPILDLGGGWYGIGAFRNANYTASLRILNGPSVASNSIFEQSGESFFVDEPQATAGEFVRSPYQRVGNAYDITEAGVPSVYYAHYDGADDVLPSSLTIPSISEGCFILVGTAGIWIDNEWVNTTGTLTVGPTTYTGGPSGILPVVGNILSIIWREEPLTDQERQKVIQAGIKRGSPGEI